MKLQFVEWSSFMQLIDEHKFDALAIRFSGGSIEPDPKQLWHSTSGVSGGSNIPGLADKEIDSLIDKVRLEMDAKKRIPIFHRIAERIAEEVPVIFLWNEKYQFYAHTQRVNRIKDTYVFKVGLETWALEK